MHDEKTVNRFIELRASGWTYARLMTELNVSKPTLIGWSRKHQFQILQLAFHSFGGKRLGESVSIRVHPWLNCFSQGLAGVTRWVYRRHTRFW